MDKTINFPEPEDVNLLMPAYTPFGGVRAFLDGKPVPLRISHGESLLEWPDGTRIDENKRILVDYESDGDDHYLDIVLDAIRPCEYGPASGEWVEAVEFWDEDTYVAIAAHWDMDCELLGFEPFDYDVSKIETGLSVHIYEETKSKTFVFGIAWANSTDEIVEHAVWKLSAPFEGFIGLGAALSEAG